MNERYYEATRHKYWPLVKPALYLQSLISHASHRPARDLCGKKKEKKKKGYPPRSACSYCPLMQLFTSPLLCIRVISGNTTFIADGRWCKSSQSLRRQSASPADLKLSSNPTLHPHFSINFRALLPSVLKESKSGPRYENRRRAHRNNWLS